LCLLGARERALPDTSPDPSAADADATSHAHPAREDGHMPTETRMPRPTSPTPGQLTEYELVRICRRAAEARPDFKTPLCISSVPAPVNQFCENPHASGARLCYLAAFRSDQRPAERLALRSPCRERTPRIGHQPPLLGLGPSADPRRTVMTSTPRRACRRSERCERA